MSELLMVSLPPAAGYPQAARLRLPPSFYAVDGRPLLMAYVACFGTLFLLIRWWRQADPLRSTRLSLWTTDRSASWWRGWWRGRGSSRSPGCRWSPARSPCRCSWPARGDGRANGCEENADGVDVIASLAESMGEFWFGKVSKLVI